MLSQVQNHQKFKKRQKTSNNTQNVVTTKVPLPPSHKTFAAAAATAAAAKWFISGVVFKILWSWLRRCNVVQWLFPDLHSEQMTSIPVYHLCWNFKTEDSLIANGIIALTRVPMRQTLHLNPAAKTYRRLYMLVRQTKRTNHQVKDN